MSHGAGDETRAQAGEDDALQQGAASPLGEEAGLRRSKAEPGMPPDADDRKQVHDAEAALFDSEARFRQFAEASSDILWIRDAESLQLEYLSPAFKEIYGVSCEEALGGDDRWTERIVPEDRAQMLACMARARAGVPALLELRISQDGRTRWLRTSIFPILDQHGRVQRIGGITRDITELKLALDRQQRLLAETQHSVRNMLAMIRSIVRRTAENSESESDFASHLDGRIAAFSRVQVALTRDPLAGFDLAELIAEELRSCAAREGEQYTLHGPPVRLKAKAAESLGLAIHELATNAVKHGAFTVAAGRIDVCWRKEDEEGEPWLSLGWTESGMLGRPVVQARAGFGTLLLQETLQYDLGARVTRAFEPNGFRCTISFPLAANAF